MTVNQDALRNLIEGEDEELLTEDAESTAAFVDALLLNGVIELPSGVEAGAYAFTHPYDEPGFVFVLRPSLSRGAQPFPLVNVAGLFTGLSDLRPDEGTAAVAEEVDRQLGALLPAYAKLWGGAPESRGEAHTGGDVKITIPDDAWEDVDPDNPGTHIITTIVVNDRSLHLEGIEVYEDPENHGVHEPTDPSKEEDLTRIYVAAESTDTRLETMEVAGRCYVVLATPFTD